MPDPEGLSRGELVELVRDRAAQLKEQDRQIEALRSELERLRRLLTRNRGGRGARPPSADIKSQPREWTHLLVCWAHERLRLGRIFPDCELACHFVTSRHRMATLLALLDLSLQAVTTSAEGFKDNRMLLQYWRRRRYYPTRVTDTRIW